MTRAASMIEIWLWDELGSKCNSTVDVKCVYKFACNIHFRHEESVQLPARIDHDNLHQTDSDGSANGKEHKH